MKGFAAAILAALAVMCVCAACGEREEEQRTYAAVIGGQDVIVTFAPDDNGAGTISTGHGNYSFAYGMQGELTITYPDGQVFTYHSRDGIMTGTGSLTGSAEGYLDGISLAWGIEDVMEERNGGRKDGPSPLPALALMALGCWHLFAPRSVWQLSHGWRYKNAEPSELAIGLNRAGGVLMALVGAVWLLAAL